MNKDRYLRILGKLFLLIRKVRVEGLMAIEDQIEYSYSASPLHSKISNENKSHLILSDLLGVKLGRSELIEQAVYTDFICDIARLMVGGNFEVKDIERYAQNFIENILSSKHGKTINCSVLKLIKEVLVATCSGYAPSTAIELGRSLVPVVYEISFNELEDYCKKVRNEFHNANNRASALTFDQRIENIYARLKSKQ